MLHMAHRIRNAVLDSEVAIVEGMLRSSHVLRAAHVPATEMSSSHVATTHVTTTEVTTSHVTTADMTAAHVAPSAMATSAMRRDESRWLNERGAKESTNSQSNLADHDRFLPLINGCVNWQQFFYPELYPFAIDSVNGFLTFKPQPTNFSVLWALYSY